MAGTLVWIRIWVDFMTDPKWKTIARVSGHPVAYVMCVAIILMLSAANSTKRGRTQINDEDLASLIEVDEAVIVAIKAAMQGRILKGDLLTGWEKRQPLREDGSAERAREWRAKKKAERTQTHATAPEHQEEIQTREDPDKDIGGEPPITPGAVTARDDSPVVIEGQAVVKRQSKASRRAKSDTTPLCTVAFDLPAWVSADAWEAFDELRRRNHGKAPWTDRARNRIVKQLHSLREQGQDVDAVLWASYNGGWTDVYAQKALLPAVRGRQRPAQDFSAKNYSSHLEATFLGAARPAQPQHPEGSLS